MKVEWLLANECMSLWVDLQYDSMRVIAQLQGRGQKKI